MRSGRKEDVSTKYGKFSILHVLVFRLKICDSVCRCAHLIFDIIQCAQLRHMQRPSEV